MLETLAAAEIGVLFSPILALSALVTFLTATTFMVVGAVRGWGLDRMIVGALCSSYVNAGNLGIAVAHYVLGDASLVAPVLLLQLLVFTPLFLVTLDLITSGEPASPWQRAITPFRNPVVWGCLVGVIFSATDSTIPMWLLQPVALLGAMAVPSMLLAYGYSLHGSPLPGRSEERAPVLLATSLKVLAAPTASWVLGEWVFALPKDLLFAVVVMAALPTAQNLFTYALRYGTAVRLCREVILVTTVCSLPVLVMLGLLVD
jgi:predicted permease